MNGIIHVLKPPGMTSNNLVAAVKRILNVAKTGHTGTLDPGACGVLSVCVGRATKLADYLVSGKKTYITSVRFGADTDTLDSYGTVTRTGGGKATLEALKEACAAFVGEQQQIPPMYSAIKVDGRKMYELARQGKEIELAPRTITVYGIEILEMDEVGQTCLLEVECSAGTYIRTLCADMAKNMGCMGYVSFLMRSRASFTNVEDCCTLDELEQMAGAGDKSFLIPPDMALEAYPVCMLDEYLFPIVTTGTPIDLGRIRNGREIPRKGYMRVYCRNTFIGMGETEENMLKIKTMYYIG